MNSTMNRTLLSTGTAGRLVLPAAVDAPAALVIAVDVPSAQETSADAPVMPLAGAGTDGTTSFSGHTSARVRTALQVPPPRGTPV